MWLFLLGIALALFLLVWVATSRSIIQWRAGGCCNSHPACRVVMESEPTAESETHFNPSMFRWRGVDGLAVRVSGRRQDSLWKYARGHFGTNRSSVVFEPSSMGIPPLPGPEQWEDPRAAIHDGTLYVVVCAEVKTGWVMPHIFRLGDDNQWSKQPMKLTGLGRIQKNWCPTSSRDRFILHTDSWPVWRVRELDLDSGQLKTITEWDSTRLFPASQFVNLRGSTSMVSWTRRTLLLCLHCKEFYLGLPRFTTVFVEVARSTLVPLRRSHPFCLSPSHERIQFVSGLASLPHSVKISLGLADAQYQVLEITRTEIDSLLAQN